MSELRDADPFDVRRALRPPAALRAFNEAGVLAAADVHVAARLPRWPARTTPTSRSRPRWPSARRGSATSTSTSPRCATPTVVDVEEPVDIAALPWPEVGGVGGAARGEPRWSGGPLRLEGTRVYLDRYWREERQIADDLRAFARRRRRRRVDEDVLARRRSRGCSAPDDERQRARRGGGGAAAARGRRRRAGHGQDDDGGADRRAAGRAGRGRRRARRR